MLTSPPQIRAEGWEAGGLQLLNLAIKLTGANHGALLRVNGRRAFLSRPENRPLPRDYWEAAREVSRNLIPLLFQGKEGKAGRPILAVPVQQPHGLLGVLVLGDRPQRPLNHDDLNLVLLLAASPSLVADSPALREEQTIYLLDSVKTLLQTLEARDHYSCQHSSRVTEIALYFGRSLALPQEDLAAIKTASLLHDLGKVGISDAILLKQGPLTQEECVIMKTHPGIGEKIVKPLGLQPREMEIILHHHERWDGRGYPWGLAEAEIPFLCRLVALADVFDALTSDRPYRGRFPSPVALEEITAHAGTQFDPKLTHKFVRLIASQAQ